MTLQLLNELNYRDATICAARAGTNSRRPDAPPLDFVFTVCDQAAGEVVPGMAGTADHGALGLPDPAAFVGSDEAKRALLPENLRRA